MGFDCCSQVSSFDEYLSIRDTAMASLHPFYHEKWDSHQLTLPVVVDVAECILFVKDCIALHELITIDVLDAVLNYIHVVHLISDAPEEIAELKTQLDLV